MNYQRKKKTPLKNTPKNPGKAVTVFQAVLGVSIEKKDAKVEEFQKGEETEKKDVTPKELVKVEKMGNVLKMSVKKKK
jgi:hypothetical protein